MPLIPKVYQGNRLEVLLQALSAELQRQMHHQPFAPRLIIAPGGAWQHYIPLELAKISPKGLAMGFQMATLPQGLERLRHTLFVGVSNAYIPSTFELGLAIEHALHLLVQDYGAGQLSSHEEKLWQEVFIALGLKKQSHSCSCAKLDQPLHQLSAQLAQLFLIYAEYAPELIDSWSNEQNPVSHWQHKLWQKLFCPRSTSLWQIALDLRYRRLPPDFASDLQVHLIGIQHLSEPLQTFFSHIAEHIAFTYYVLSPCQLYWSDILSDRESAKVQRYWQKRGVSARQLGDLEGFLRERNSLLANFGRLGRERACQLESFDHSSFEDYRIAAAALRHSAWQQLWPASDSSTQEEEDGPLSALAAIQADMATLRKASCTDRIALATSDRSIQVHACCSLLREVQVAYDIVYALIAQHSSDRLPLQPRDIILVAPDIDPYTPYLEAVFSSRHSAFAYQLWGSSCFLAQSGLVAAFFHLLDLAESRWGTENVMDLFESPSFRSCHNLSDDALEVMRAWLHTSAITWGFDAGHRTRLLTHSGCLGTIPVEDAEIGTWKWAMEGLCMALVKQPRHESAVHCYDHSATLPQELSFELGQAFALEGVDSTQAQELQKIFSLLCQLYSDLATITKGLGASLLFWADYLEKLLSTYFATSDDNQSGLGQQLLESALEQLRRCHFAIKDNDGASFPYSSVRSALEQILHAHRSASNLNNLQAVRCGSMEALCGLPAKVVICLGLSDSNFPRSEGHSHLNLLYKVGAPATYFPLKRDRDRYLFLQALLAARGYFITTFCTMTPEGKDDLLSFLVSELLANLDEGYLFGLLAPSEHCYYEHPVTPFDWRCFTSSSRHWPVSAAPFYRKIAQKQGLTGYKKVAHSPCFLRFTTPAIAQPKQPVAYTPYLDLSIKDLNTCARNPLQLYFNKRLGIYLDKGKGAQQRESASFELGSLDQALLLRQALKIGLKPTLERAYHQGKMPAAAFKYIAVDKLHTDTTSLINHLKALEIDPATIFQVTLCPGCTEASYDAQQRRWLLPPLILPQKLIAVEANQNEGSSHYSYIRLVGHLEDLCSQGLLAHLKSDKKQICKAWPTYLIACCLAQRGCLPLQPNLILTKSAECKQPFFDDPTPLLAAYIGYYLRALQAPSALLPEWIADLIEQTPAQFALLRQKERENPFAHLYNDYLQWGLAPTNSFEEAAEYSHHWREIAHALFHPLFSAWF